MGVATRHPLPGGGARLCGERLVLDELAGAVLAALSAPKLVWDAALDGDPESVRYAVESSRIEAACRPAWRPGLTHVVASIGGSAAAALHDAWTPGLALAVSTVIGGRRVSVARFREDEVDVEGEGVVAIENAMRRYSVGPAVRTLRTAAVGETPASPPFRRLIAVGMAVLVAIAGVTTWTLLHHGKPALSRAPSSTLGPPQVSSPADIVVPPLPALSRAAVTVDPRDGTVLVAGCCGSGARTALWRWSNGLWTAMGAMPGAPKWYTGTALAWDPSMHAFVLQGGDSTAGTWLFDGTRWQATSPEHTPVAGTGILVYDDAAKALVFVAAPGSYNTLAQSWTWNGSDWTPVPGPGPILNGAATAVYDPVRHDVVLLDLAGSVNSNAVTWTFDGAWSERTTPTAPPWDPSTQLAWDAHSRRIVAMLFGDTALPARGIIVPADTWTWDGAAWAHPRSASAPTQTGRLLSWLGTPVFMADAGNPSQPTVATWSDTGWTLYSGRGPLQRRSPDSIGNLLAAAHLTLIRSLPLPSDPGAAVPPAFRAAYPDITAAENERVAATLDGDVSSAGSLLCHCIAIEVLRTYLPPCPAMEVVAEDAVTLIDSQSGGVVRVFREAAPPGTVFGSC